MRTGERSILLARFFVSGARGLTYEIVWSRLLVSVFGGTTFAITYPRFGADAEANPDSTVNECGSCSSNSNESCTTGATSGAETLLAAVHAWSAFTNLTITCTSADAGSCCPAGAPCSANGRNGRSGGKPGTRVCL